MQELFRKAVRDEKVLEAALEHADISPTLMVLVQLTGDIDILSEVAPHIKGPWSFMESVPQELKAKVRGLLIAALKEHAASDRTPDVPAPDVLRQMMTVAVGEAVSEDYVPLLLEEMRFDGKSSRTVGWRRDSESLQRDKYRVTIIGAGLAGICAAVQLKEAGIPFVILEKNASVGGTWFENTYPGCGVDTPNHFFSYSFNPHNDWSHHFSKQGEILQYIERTVEKYGLLENIRFGAEVFKASFNEGTNTWDVEYIDNQGVRERLTSHILISAVGQLNRPSVPKIEGLELFEGPKFHTARWRNDFDPCGKRVAMIGTGASGMQVGPAIAPDVAELTIFQRSPHWVMRNPNYHKEVSEGQRWALNNIPFFSEWLRFQLFWASAESFHDTLRADPGWPMAEISLNKENHAVRESLITYIRSEIGDDEALIAKCIPNYPPYGKRMLRDNDWYRMLRRKNVNLVSDSISHVTHNAIVTESGDRHFVDALILATGFQAARIMWPMDIQGRHGISIRQIWGDDDPRAYKGISVPQFPNMFVMYGPNTNPGPGGSTIFYFECQMRYIMQVVREMVEGDYAAMEVRQDVHDRYNEVVDDRCRNMVWSHKRVRSWYKNAANRITVNSPWRQLEYWQLTRTFDPADYHIKTRAASHINKQDQAEPAQNDVSMQGEQRRVALGA